MLAGIRDVENARRTVGEPVNRVEVMLVRLHVNARRGGRRLTMAIIGVVLLIVGLAMRLSSRPGRGSGPMWRARQAFASHQAYVRYIVGTSCISVGAILVAILALHRVLAR
jgi:hypothetical protein